ncbi:hypothetical protein P8452_75144 [Trifolium repens]|nr:hypothetical protein P8452_75144 [Trifolium repens]
MDQYCKAQSNKPIRMTNKQNSIRSNKGVVVFSMCVVFFIWVQTCLSPFLLQAPLPNLGFIFKFQIPLKISFVASLFANRNLSRPLLSPFSFVRFSASSQTSFTDSLPK